MKILINTDASKNKISDRQIRDSAYVFEREKTDGCSEDYSVLYRVVKSRGTLKEFGVDNQGPVSHFAIQNAVAKWVKAKQGEATTELY